MNEQERIRNKEYQKKWRQTNAAKIVEYRRSHGREHYQRYKERILAANKRWREKQRLNNPQYISMEMIRARAYKKQWRLKNLARLRKVDREYKAKHYQDYKDKANAARREKWANRPIEERSRDKEYRRDYWKRHKTAILVRHKANRHKLRMAVLLAYGGKCVCCGEKQFEFLSIDHINGGGNKHRKEIGRSSIYPWLRSNHFPPGFQVLCFNCNQAKHVFGTCPHRSAPLHS